MSSLRAYPAEAQRLADLRCRAASRLTGAAATNGSSLRAIDALAVLHDLASDPDTAPAALTLLHELQVHQVELDLQAQELHESREALEVALRRQIDLYDCLPVGCFTLDRGRVLHEMNLTGAGMLGLRRDEGVGSPMDAFFTPESTRLFGAMIADLGAGSKASSRLLRLCAKDGPERSVLVSIGPDPAGQGYLVSMAHAAEEKDRPSGSS